MENNKVGLILLIGLVIVGSIFLFKKDTYIGFYYPNQNDLTKHIQSEKLTSLEECRSWIEAQEGMHTPSGYGYDYECGKNCKEPDSADSLYICEETLE